MSVNNKDRVLSPLFYKDGGTLNKDGKEFASYLYAISGAKNDEELQKFLLDTGMEEINKLYTDWKSNKSKVMEAKDGARIDYIKRLQGRCPEGYEVEKYMAGGCVKCRKKAMAEGNKVIDVFKDKCGGKAKKRIKKNEDGNTITKNDTIHTKKGIYNLSNKKTPYKKMTPSDYRKLSPSEQTRVDMKDQGSGRAQSEAATARSNKIGKKLNGGTLVAFKCGGKAKKRIKKNMGGTVSNKWSIPSNAKGDAIRHINGGPGSADSTREMKFNGFQKKALAGKSYK